MSESLAAIMGLAAVCSEGLVTAMIGLTAFTSSAHANSGKKQIYCEM